MSIIFLELSNAILASFEKQPLFLFQQYGYKAFITAFCFLGNKQSYVLSSFLIESVRVSTETQ